MERTVLLNVGPVMVPAEVRQAMLQPDLCHREEEFSEILLDVRQKLTRLFGGNEKYSTVIFGGSGTAALEAVISSAVKGKKILVISNGYYGDKIERLANIHKIEVRTLKYQWGEQIKKEDVERILSADPALDFVAMVHNETSTGILNPVQQIGSLVSRYKRKFIVDAVSSIGVEDINVVRDGINFCIGSPNKCIESVPGLSFVCVDRESVLSLSNMTPSTSYLDLYNHFICEEGLGERPGTPFTPPVQAFFALDVALDRLLLEGTEERRKRYSSRASIIREGLKALGFKLFIPEELSSNSITSVITPKNISYSFIHDQLKERGFVIYAGQGNLESNLFRVGNMGDLTTQDLKQFLEALAEVLSIAKQSEI